MIYLDNAATTFPKPANVASEVNKCITKYCGNPGRGAHKLSLEAARKIFECRNLLANFFGTNNPEGIIFTQNTTYALNLIIKGFLKKNDHVLISDIEHNAVLRPVHRLYEDGLIEYDIFATDVLSGGIDASKIISNINDLIRPNTKMLICTHSSNICGANLPIETIGRFCKEKGIFFAVDAAQSAGHLPIDMEKMNIDALAAPAHKGLYGIQGCGVAIIRSDGLLDTLIEGGNGVASLERTMPDFSPERYESGTLPTPAIAGLSEGIKFITGYGIGTIHSHETELFKRAVDLLSAIPHLTLYAPHHHGSTLLFNLNDIPSESLAGHLDSQNIAARGGFHCTPLAHSALKTPKTGAVRISFGIFNRLRDIEKTADAIRTYNLLAARSSLN